MYNNTKSTTKQIEFKHEVNYNKYEMEFQKKKGGIYDVFF